MNARTLSAMATCTALAACSPSNGQPDGGIDVRMGTDATMSGDTETSTGTDAPLGSDVPNGMPTIAITSPMQGGMVMADAAHHVSVTFSVTNFNLMPEGNCNGMPRCGHVDLTIDGALCGSPYNALGASSPLVADFSRCPAGMQTGMHTIQLELRDDNFAPLTPPVTAYVMVTVM